MCSDERFSVTARLFNEFVNLISEVSSIWEKNNRQLSIDRRKLCKTVRFFTESWRVFTWKDHQRTDLLSSSSVTSEGLNRLRSSAGYFIWRQLQWILFRGGRKSVYPAYKFYGNYFCNGNNKDRAGGLDTAVFEKLSSYFWLTHCHLVML